MTIPSQDIRRQQPTHRARTRAPRRVLSARAQRPQRGRFWPGLFIGILLCLWQGLPFSLFRGNALLSYQIFAVISGLGVILYFLRLWLGQIVAQHWEMWALALFLVCVLVSANFSMFLVPQPLFQWLPTIYSISPIIIIFLLKALDFTVEDVMGGLIWTAVIASTAVIFVRLTDLPFLDYYMRGSAFSDSRIILMKSEVSLAVMALIGRLLESPMQRKWLPLLLLLPLGFDLVVLTESRIYILATVASTGLLVSFVARPAAKLASAILAPIFALPLIWYVVASYFANFTSLNNYLSSDTSAKWRVITIKHFSNYFYNNTNGFGFGFMSARPEYNNFISYSSNRAGALYGVPNYPVGLDDIGLYSALYQYGYIGLALVFGMSLAMIFALARAHKTYRAWTQVSAIGILLLILMINPVSQNYFTIFGSAQMGGFLWFVASRVSAAQTTKGRKAP